MDLKGHIAMTAAVAASALTFVGIAAGQDAHERSAGSALTFVGTPAGQDAHERAARVRAASTDALVGYVDGPQRGESLVGARGETIVGAEGSGFDWGSAMVGASSALVLALLIGVSLVTLRRFRGGSLAH